MPFSDLHYKAVTHLYDVHDCTDGLQLSDSMEATSSTATAVLQYDRISFVVNGRDVM
jgi:hypothetical protein